MKENRLCKTKISKTDKDGFSRAVFRSRLELKAPVADHESLVGKISVQPHPTLCIQFLNRENNDKNNTLPLGKQICFTMVWGCAETLPFSLLRSCFAFYGEIFVKNGH